MAGFEVRPKSVALSGHQAQLFEAVRDGQPVAGVTWSLQPTKGSGTIDKDTGLYASPRFVFFARRVHVQAIIGGAPRPGAASGPAAPPPTPARPAMPATAAVPSPAAAAVPASAPAAGQAPASVPAVAKPPVPTPAVIKAPASVAPAAPAVQPGLPDDRDAAFEVDDRPDAGAPPDAGGAFGGLPAPAVDAGGLPGGPGGPGQPEDGADAAPEDDADPDDDEAPPAGAQVAIATVELTSLRLWTAALGIYWMAWLLGLLSLLVILWNGMCPTCRLKISPPVVTLTDSQPQFFTANTDVNWLTGVQANGLYTPKDKITADRRETVTATSSADPKRSAAADVFLSTDFGLYVHPQDSQVESSGGNGSRVVLIASVTHAAAAAGESAPHKDESVAPPRIEWLQPTLGRIEPVQGPAPVNGSVAAFYADKVKITRPTTVLVLAHLEGRMSRVAGAWITILPRSFQPFGWQAEDCASDMVGILTLIAIMGALGGIVHGIASFGLFVGNRELKVSWLWWYFLKPFLGAAVSLVVYLVFRAGLGGNDYSLGSADCVKVAALAGLIGLFAEPATTKLRDIFNTLFTTKDDQRKDPAGAVALKLDRLDPQSVTAGDQSQCLRILGSGFTGTSQVKLGDTPPRQPTNWTPTELDVSLLAGDVKTPQELPVVVISNGQRSNALTLSVKAVSQT